LSEEKVLAKPRTFISYTNIDTHGNKFGSELKKQLELAGYDVFFFDHSKRHHLGRPLLDVLAEEIDNRDAIIVVCTEAIVASYGADFEYNHAWCGEKLIVPLQYDEATVPRPLTSRIYDDFDDNNYVQKFAVISKTLPESYSDHLKRQQERQKLKITFTKKAPAVSKRVEASTMGLKLLNSIVKAYNEYSLLQDLCVVRNYDPSVHSDLSFGQLGHRYSIPREWMEKTSGVLIVDDLGISIAIGERNHLRDV